MKLGSERDVCVISSLRRQPGRRRHYCRSFRNDGRRLSRIARLNGLRGQLLRGSVVTNVAQQCPTRSSF